MIMKLQEEDRRLFEGACVRGGSRGRIGLAVAIACNVAIEEGADPS